MRKQIHVFLLAFFLFGFFAETKAENPFDIETLFSLESVVETAISPQQDAIAFTLNTPRPFTDKPGGNYRELHLFDLRTGETSPLITGEYNIFDIGWHPDGERITFRARFDSQTGVQVYAIPRGGGDSTVFTQAKNGVRSYAFLDHMRMLVTSLDDSRPEIEERQQKGISIDVYEEEYRHINLYIYDTQSHELDQITEGVTIFDFVLSPDNLRVAAAVAPRNLVDDSYMFKRIHIINIYTKEMEQLVDNPGKLGKMAWSPDGSKLAFQSASKLQDAVNGSLFVAGVPNDKAFETLTNQVQDMELSIIDLDWKDNETLLYAAEEGVNITLSEKNINQDDRNVIIEGGQVVFRRFEHQNGMIAIAGNTPSHPNELFLYDMGRERLFRLTQLNPKLRDIELAQQGRLTYEARDGKQIEGVLIYPLNFEEGKRYPLITYIHGGPEAAVQNGWVTRYSTWGQVAAARGYFVFMPNYRASSGRGVDFTMAGYGDLVGVEYDDVLDGIDYLIRQGAVDKDRVGIGGGSYGGYFSAWSATKHTERFAAAVVFVGIGNQVSKRNTTDIPWEDYHVHWGYWTHEDYEDVYSRSPVKYAHQSQTPTLVLHGDSDPRVHPSQGLEIYRTLKLHGNAPVRLIWYKGEGHGNRRHVHQLDYIKRTLDWFDYYLQSDKPKDEMPDKYLDYGF